MDGGLSQFTLRLALIAAAAASVLVLTGLFSDGVRYGCVGVVVAATILTATERRRPGGGWWTLLAAGALLSAAGAGLAELNDTLGGLCAVTGGAFVVIAATIGFPADDV
jgi:hypothetical protein